MTDLVGSATRPPAGRNRMAATPRESAHLDLASLTIGAALRERAARSPDDVVVREKDQGVYHAHTWAQYLEDVTALACALRRRGLRPAHYVAVMGDPTYRFMLADAAVILAGGVAFGIYTTCSPEEVRHQIRTAGATILIAENQEYVDRFLEVASDCPTVDHVIVDDTRALFGYDDHRIESFDDVLAEGAAASPEEQADLLDVAATVSVDDPAMLIFTSGTTGPSKAAMITPSQRVGGRCAAALHRLPGIAPPGGGAGGGAPLARTRLRADHRAVLPDPVTHGGPHRRGAGDALDNAV